MPIIPLLVSWAALTIGLFLAAKILKGMTIHGGVGAHLMVSAVYGLLLFFLGGCLQFVLKVGSLGLLALFSFLAQWIAGTILLIVTDKMTKSLKIDGIGTAALAALIAAVFSAVASWGFAQLNIG